MSDQETTIHPKYRADIDGLRAIAVLAVVAFHAFPEWIKGGFIGVDIFFVISGFLISSIIFSNLEHNSFSFIGFYSRRIKRIYPALLLILIFCLVFGWFALLAEEYMLLGKHIAGGAGFAANFVLWSESGYFDNIAETKPLLHLWSLGIEEQFYIVWPILLWFAWKRQFNRITILFLITGISFYLNISARSVDPTGMFYSPQTRFWELLIGSALALIQLHKHKCLNQIANFLNVSLNRIIYENPDNNAKALSDFQSFLGLILIIAGILIITQKLAFPGWWAVVPTLGSALIIGAGSYAWTNRSILANPILVWFGLISFPLYLWHWPLLSFTRIIEGDTPSIKVRFIVVALSITLAWLTYRFIEKPIRFGRYNRLKTAILFILMAIVGFTGYFIFKHDGLTERSIAKNLKQKSLDMQKYEPEVCTDKRFSGIDMSWCTQSKPMETKIDYILWGDSHAEHLFPAIKKMDVNFLLIGRSSCPTIIDPPNGIKLWRGRYFDEGCFLANTESLKLILEKTTPIVVMSSLGALYIERNGFAAEHKDVNFDEDYKVVNRKEVYEIGLQSAVNALLIAGKKVVLIKDVPEFPINPKGCINRPFKYNSVSCDVSRKDYEDRTKDYSNILNKIKATSKNIYIFDAAAIFCDETSCKSNDTEHVYFRDGHHLGVVGSDKVTEALMEFLKKIPEN